MANHTPEPWVITEFGNVSTPGNDGISVVAVSGFGNFHPDPGGCANTRRIVACVNACAGIPDDALNDLDGILNKIKAAIEINGTIALADEAKLAALTAQRDELLEALKVAKSWLEGWASAEHELAVIRSAIEKCEVQNDEQ